MLLEASLNCVQVVAGDGGPQHCTCAYLISFGASGRRYHWAAATVCMISKSAAAAIAAAAGHEPIGVLQSHLLCGYDDLDFLLLACIGLAVVQYSGIN